VTLSLAALGSVFGATLGCVFAALLVDA